MPANDENKNTLNKTNTTTKRKGPEPSELPHKKLRTDQTTNTSDSKSNISDTDSECDLTCDEDPTLIEEQLRLAKIARTNQPTSHDLTSLNTAVNFLNEHRAFIAASFKQDFSYWVESHTDGKEQAQLRAFSRELVSELTNGYDEQQAGNARDATEYEIISDPRARFMEAVLASPETERIGKLNKFLSHKENSPVVHCLANGLPQLSPLARRWETKFPTQKENAVVPTQAKRSPPPPSKAETAPPRNQTGAPPSKAIGM
jgi:hypothetical protein